MTKQLPPGDFIGDPYRRRPPEKKQKKIETLGSKLESVRPVNSQDCVTGLMFRRPIRLSLFTKKKSNFIFRTSFAKPALLNGRLICPLGKLTGTRLARNGGSENKLLEQARLSFAISFRHPFASNGFVVLDFQFCENFVLCSLCFIVCLARTR